MAAATTPTSSTTTATSSSVSSSTPWIFADNSSSCRDLLLELKRSSGSGNSHSNHHSSIPLYNDALVRRSIHELQLYSQQLEQFVEAATTKNDAITTNTTSNNSNAAAASRKPDMSVRPALFLLEAMIQRHKQCLLTYHKVRWDRLRQHINGNTTATLQPLLLTKHLSEAEQDLWKNYNQLVHSHMSQTWEFRAASGSDPFTTSSTMCQVRVIHPQPMTVVLSSTGQVVELTPGAILYVPRDDVQDLFQQGLLEPVAGEEDLE